MFGDAGGVKGFRDLRRGQFCQKPIGLYHPLFDIHLLIICLKHSSSYGMLDGCQLGTIEGL